MITRKVGLSVLVFVLGFFMMFTGVNADQNQQSPLDLIFVIDTTGSMWDDIANVKARATDIVNTIASNVADYRIAVVDYRDFPVSPYGGAIDYPYKADLAFSSDKAEIINALQGLALGWGYDWQESVYSALVRSIFTENLTPWRCEARKCIVLMGDAPPHDPEPFTGYTADSVVDAAKMVIDNCEKNTASVYSIVIGGDYYANQYFSYISEETGGKVFTAPTAATVVDTIIEVIDDIETPPEPEDPPAEPSNYAPVCKNAIASVTEIWPPNHKMRAIEILNVTDPDGDPVFITITGITQDEPVNAAGDGNADPDGEGIGTDTAWIRAERSGLKNSRVYEISFTATDDKGAECSGTVQVCVRHDKGLNTFCIDDGQDYDSTVVVESTGGKGGKKK